MGFLYEQSAIKVIESTDSTAPSFDPFTPPVLSIVFPLPLSLPPSLSLSLSLSLRVRVRVRVRVCVCVCVQKWAVEDPAALASNGAGEGKKVERSFENLKSAVEGLGKHREAVDAIRFLPGARAGARCLTKSVDGNVCLWDWVAGKTLAAWKVPGPSARCYSDLDVTQDGRYVQCPLSPALSLPLSPSLSP